MSESLNDQKVGQLENSTNEDLDNSTIIKLDPHNSTRIQDFIDVFMDRRRGQGGG